MVDLEEDRIFENKMLVEEAVAEMGQIRYRNYLIKEAEKELEQENARHLKEEYEFYSSLLPLH